MTHFDRLPRWGAQLLLAVVFGVILYGILAPPAVKPPKPPPHLTQTDGELYLAIMGRMARGEDYYAAAAVEQRTRGYPMFPWFTVRPPALAELTTGLGGERGAGILLKLIAVAATIAIVLRLRSWRDSLVFVGAGATVTALAVSFPANVTLFHESWAALLILLSLALWSEEHVAASVLTGVAAVAIRELTLPYLLVMLVMAIVRRRRTETLAWSAAVLMIVATLARHARAVEQVRLATDQHSPGWASAGGWPFILRMMKETTVMGLLPAWCIALLIPVALLGWASWRHPIALRATAYLCGMIGAFMLVGRPNNVYWGIIIAPLLPIGLLFAPQALQVLIRRAAGPGT
ncbi:MAG: hypothetical protein V4813_00140 [Gemmatimonadota bacterium]